MNASSNQSAHLVAAEGKQTKELHNQSEQESSHSILEGGDRVRNKVHAWNELKATQREKGEVN